MNPMTQPTRQLAHGILPRQAQDRLIAASLVEGERERRVAIDAAIDHVKLHYSQYFNQSKP